MQVAKKQVLKEGLQLDLSEMDDFQKSILDGWDQQKNGFDTRVHIIDPKTGQLLKFQPYRREVINGDVVYYRLDESGREKRYSEKGHSLDAAPVQAPALAVEKKPHDKSLSR